MCGFQDVDMHVAMVKRHAASCAFLYGQAALRHALRHYMAHYHTERNHQGLGKRLLQPVPVPALLNSPIKQRQRLGGMLNYYYREAA